MRPRDQQRANQIESDLVLFSKTVRPLPGIDRKKWRRVFVEQILESIHRVEYVKLVSTRAIADGRIDPSSELFDPIKAAIAHDRSEDFEEATWLVFLLVQFGKHAKGGWQYVRDIYGRLGDGNIWTWATVVNDIPGFRTWLESNKSKIRENGSPGGFGNHRKYESLSGSSHTGTGATVESYVRWIDPPRTQDQMFKQVLAASGGCPMMAFSRLYESMDTVVRFGRTAKFDYLTMLGNTGLVNIKPASPYIRGASGPLTGARLLFTGSVAKSVSPSRLETWAIELGNATGLGMQVLEDSLCNWQKSPSKFVRFRG